MTAQHRFPVRVYYEDTDAGGIVYYANYLKFAERARTELLRVAGYDHNTIRRDHGFGFAVRRCSAEYLRPALLDDALEVATTVERVGGASFEMRQRIARDGEPIADVDVLIACIGRDGGSARMPRGMRDALRGYAAGQAEQLKT